MRKYDAIGRGFIDSLTESYQLVQWAAVGEERRCCSRYCVRCTADLVSRSISSLTIYAICRSCNFEEEFNEKWLSSEDGTSDEVVATSLAKPDY